MAGIQQPRGIPAHPPGPTFLSYTPNGRKLITVGLTNSIRVFQTDSVDEPANIDDAQESNTAIAAANDFFITGSEDGTVCKYSLETNSLDKLLARCHLPVRDVALSPDSRWVAVASGDNVVRVVNTRDDTRILLLQDHLRPAKHVSFGVNGNLLAVSCTNGRVYIYSFSPERQALLKNLEGVIKPLQANAEASSKALWHPNGRAFAAATHSRGEDIQIISTHDWEPEGTFASGHSGDVTSVAWSPNGRLLASTGFDRRLLIWDATTRRTIKAYNDCRATILAMAWHPVANTLSYTNSDGELFIHTDFVPPEFTFILHQAVHDPLGDASRNVPRLSKPYARQGTPDPLDEILGVDATSDVDGFIDDDDGAGYAEHFNVNAKRGRALDDLALPPGKHSRAALHIRTHPAFQPGSTPWRGSHRYLCLNLIGFVWTVDQQTHHTVTVEFYDRGAHRDFHFTDPFLYDKACLNENGTLFSCQPSKDNPATIHYRPHETWTARTDWRTELPPEERITAISLSDSYVVVMTSANNVRIYTLFGVPYRLYRQKSLPAVSCASWRDYVMTIGNGPVGGDGTTRLLYTIENVRRDETCQSEDTVALSQHTELTSVFFSDQGDPCIYDTTGTLLVLQHWRAPSQARWVPILDTRLLSRLASGRKTETYWPVGISDGRFHCIILKGGDAYPYFPRPLITDFELQIPVHGPKSNRRRSADGDPDAVDDNDDGSGGGLTESQSLEERFVRTNLQISLLEDLVAATCATDAQKQELIRLDASLSRILLQLLAVECRGGESRAMKAFEIVGLLHDPSDVILNAVSQIADRFGLPRLRERIEGFVEQTRHAGS